MPNENPKEQGIPSSLHAARNWVVLAKRFFSTPIGEHIALDASEFRLFGAVDVAATCYTLKGKTVMVDGFSCPEGARLQHVEVVNHDLYRQRAWDRLVRACEAAGIVSVSMGCSLAEVDTAVKDKLNKRTVANNQNETWTQIEMDILQALHGKALPGEAIAIAIKRKWPTVRDALKTNAPLRKSGAVTNKKGLWYYRPDAPPQDED